MALLAVGFVILLFMLAGSAGVFTGLGSFFAHTMPKSENKLIDKKVIPFVWAMIAVAPWFIIMLLNQ